MPVLIGTLSHLLTAEEPGATLLDLTLLQKKHGFSQAIATFGLYYHNALNVAAAVSMLRELLRIMSLIPSAEKQITAQAGYLA